MGFTTFCLGEGDQLDIRKIQIELINGLHRAASSTCNVTRLFDDNNSNFDACGFWFGNCDRQWRKELSMKLNRLATLINVLTIQIQYIDINERNEQCYAYAQTPSGGWEDHTKDNQKVSFITHAQMQSNIIHLDVKWNNAPLFGDDERPTSKFQIIAHEISHLFLKTEDYCNGSTFCIRLAKHKPAHAKKNADNWGYYIQEYTSRQRPTIY